MSKDMECIRWFEKDKIRETRQGVCVSAFRSFVDCSCVYDDDIVVHADARKRVTG